MDRSLIQDRLQKLHISDMEFPACYPELKPLEFYQVTGIEAKTIYPLIQRTQPLDKGDLLLPVPTLKFPGSHLVTQPSTDGPFLRFFLKGPELLQRVVPAILRDPRTWGHNPLSGLKSTSDPSQGQKRIIIEFSSPNIAKPFHQGHLRSTIIRGFLDNLYEGAGWDVVRVNYLGDWGKQYGLLALGFNMFGDEKALAEDPINYLYQIYVKINRMLSDERKEVETLETAGQDASKLRNDGLDEQARRYFKALCDGDSETLQLWSNFREFSIEKYKHSYARLNIRFDEYLGASMVKEESMKVAEKHMADKDLTESSEGAVIIDFTKHVPGKAGKTLGKALVRKKDGTSLYLTRDIDDYVVASDQEVHLKQLFKVVELIGNEDLRSRLSHISFGLVLGMSTRRGTVVFLDDVLREVAEKMHEVMKKNEDKYSQVSDPEKIADILGISIVMVQDMSGKRINNYHFNMDVLTAFEGDTGPYLQYSHARLCSIFFKAGVFPAELENANLTLVTEPHAVNLVRLIAQYPDTIQNTMRTLEPSTVLTYLFRLIHTLNSSYSVLRVIGSEAELMKARLALYAAVRAVLNSGLRLLGLTPVERYEQCRPRSISC
ncbi:putative Arginyl-tRNA synthetase, cytoplasmic [Aulographum hederae CBS 113979]|uniref:arginine--tRNA ligase n=1 Tax=Aulographum hederae CBS 113979 TaxID=1176131 RepID=A0A6G1HGR1_9PEZI|nr:putative Arginyl-tRNA synthetase, cytoplasmic [Aulographum hederae CBS 113979]